MTSKFGKNKIVVHQVQLSASVIFLSCSKREKRASKTLASTKKTGHVPRLYLDLVKNISASILASLVFCEPKNHIIMNCYL